MIKEEHSDAVSLYLDPLLPLWMTSFKELIQKTQWESEEIPLRHEVLRTIVKLTRAFPKETSTYLIPLLEPIWQTLVSCSDYYVKEIVNQGTGGDDQVDSDGEVFGIESTLFSMLEFVGIAARKRGLKSLMTQKNGHAGEFLNVLIHILVKYMQMTVDMVLLFMFFVYLMMQWN